MPTLNHQLHSPGPGPGAGRDALQSWETQGRLPATHRLLTRPNMLRSCPIIDVVFATNQCVGGFWEVSVPRDVWGRASLSRGSHAQGMVGMELRAAPSLLKDGRH